MVLDWDNQYNDLVLAKAVTDHTQDGDVIYDYSIINVGNASAEQMEKQILVFENARVLPVVEEGKVGVGLYKHLPPVFWHEKRGSTFQSSPRGKFLLSPP